MLLDTPVQDSPCVASVGGTEVKSSQPIGSGKTNQLCELKVKTVSLKSGCTSPAIHIIIQKAYYIFSNAYLHPAVLGPMEEIGNTKWNRVG